jgi:hypothetical protein
VRFHRSGIYDRRIGMVRGREKKKDDRLDEHRRVFYTRSSILSFGNEVEA